MGVYARAGGAWRTIPTDNTRLIYIRAGGAWKPVLDFWSRDKNQWWHDPIYAPQLAVPTNFRNNGTAGGTHDSVQVAWDYSGVLPPNDFVVQIRDQNGNALRNDVVGGGSRTWSATGLASNTYYQLAVLARYPGRSDSAFSNVLRWYTGYASYTVNDVPVYGWGSEGEYTPANYSVSSAANNDFGTWGGQNLVDGNFGNYWNSDVVNPNLDANQGEGYRLWPPGGNYLLNGVRIWNLNPHTVWYGVSLNGGFNWQGGNQPYSGKYGFLVHGYNTGVSGVYRYGDVRSGQYAINGVNVVTDCLLQSPGWDGYDWRIATIEVHFLMQPWVQTGWGPRTVPAVNSGTW